MMKRVAAVVASIVVTWLIAPHVFAEFFPVREKIVRDPVQAAGGQLHLPIQARPALEGLRAPFAAIGRVRNDSSAPLTVQLALDDSAVCRAEIAPGSTSRFDCPVTGSWVATGDHTATFTAGASPFTVEYFELATHYGAMTPGPRDLVFAPEGISTYRGPGGWGLLLIGALVFGSILSVRHPRLPRLIAIAHLALTVVVALLLLAVVVAPFLSAYALLIEQVFLERMLMTLALPAMVFAALSLTRVLWQPRVRPVAAVVATGLIAGSCYLLYANHIVTTRYRGNVSGLLHVSPQFFDPNPMVNQRADIRSSLEFSGGGGYDGQFFYFMAFDPFLSAYRDEPARYDEYIDSPSYRYGRIGFSLLTRALALGQPLRYPAVMVAIVLTALAVCGWLLALIARHHGVSPWYGLLIAIVPGFWQSIEGALPEPLAVACFLGAYLCLLRDRWLACGLLLGAALLVRETGGALALALPAGLFMAGRRREALIVVSLAFAPLAIWKLFVAWVFWPALGGEALLHAPNNTGLPFAGVVELWQRIAAGRYFDGFWPMVRAGVVFPLITTSAIVLAVVAAIRRPSPLTIAAVCYALLTIVYNYDGVWLHVGNAQRLTIDLFVVLALIGLQRWPSGRLMPRTFAAFWLVTGWYLFYCSLEADTMRDSVLGWIPGLSLIV